MSSRSTTGDHHGLDQGDIGRGDVLGDVNAAQGYQRTMSMQSDRMASVVPARSATTNSPELYALDQDRPHQQVGLTSQRGDDLEALGLQRGQVPLRDAAENVVLGMPVAKA